jgi:hypothetical protein
MLSGRPSFPPLANAKGGQGGWTARTQPPRSRKQAQFGGGLPRLLTAPVAAEYPVPAALVCVELPPPVPPSVVLLVFVSEPLLEWASARMKLSNEVVCVSQVVMLPKSVSA